jgi:ABC-type Zn2+ transport system substrate-binding protein/surface adhesin
MQRTLSLLLLLIGFVSCQPRQDTSKVLASTSWTAAYAKAAGASQVDLLAPATLLHPSEYELKLSDLGRIRNAGLIVYAGYETLVGQMLQGIGEGEGAPLKIETNYCYNDIEENVLRLADALGTKETAIANLKRLKNSFAEAKEVVVRLGIVEKPVLVHFFQQSFARELGLNVVGVFGPHQPEAYEIKSLLSTKPAFIIDNLHNPAGQSLQMAANIKRLELLNFPGPAGTSSLQDVIEYNRNILLNLE